MKKYILSIITGTVIFLSYHAYSQKFTQKIIVDTQENKSAESGAFKEGDANSTAIPEASANINSKALKNFNKTYKGSADASWYTEKHAIVASFTRDGIKNRVVYNKNGTWRFTVRTYDESKLSKDIRSLIKPVYYDYTITLVQEALVPLLDYPVYLIHLEDAQGYKVIRVANGEMDVYQSFRKN